MKAISIKKLLSLLLSICILVGTINIIPVSAQDVWAIFFEAEEARNKGKYEIAIEKFQSIIDSFIQNEEFVNSALIYGKMAMCYGELEDYHKSVENREKEAYYWGKADKIQEQKAALYKANKLRSEVKVFTTLSSDVVGEEYYNGAKYEPVLGAYLGAYAEMDPAVHSPMDGSKFYIHDFPEMTGKKHASYLIYTSYGLEFDNYASHFKRAKEEGVAIQLALQPVEGLDVVKDDEYLRQFAKDANKWGIPIFLRFANEMNGEWTEWSVKPKEYIEKFRLVSNVFHEEASNVVMVWAPNWFPEENVDDYYPGDEYVDWVGVSMYRNHQPESDPLGKGVDRSVYLDQFDKIYNTYANRKPIFISEGAISYTHIKTNEIVTEWAVNEIEKLYTYLPVLYPGVKGYFWFDRNNEVNGSKRYYMLSSNDKVLDAYKKVIKGPFYLSNIDDKSTVFYGEIKEYGLSPKKQKIFSYIKTVDPDIKKVVYKIDGKVIGEAMSLPWSIEYDFLPHYGKTVEIKVEVIGNNNKILTSNKIKSYVGNANITLDGKKVDLNSQPVITKGTTFGPVRSLVEAYGGEVGWDGATRMVIVKKGNDELRFKIDSKEAMKNGETIELDAAPFIFNSRTYLPIRFIGEELLGLNVDWNGSTRTVILEDN